METKKCIKCGTKKELKYFPKNVGKCKECINAYQKEYRKEYNKKNKDKILKSNKEYNEKNKDKILEFRKEYNIKNKDRISKDKKVYYKENKDRISKTQKKYQKENKEKISEYKKENKEKIFKYQGTYRKENKEKISKNKKNYYKENKNNICEYRKANRKKISAKYKEYYLANKNKISENNRIYNRNKRKVDASFRLRVNMSVSINAALKRNNSSKNNISCLKYLQFTVEALKYHIENLFDTWMTWENQGKFNSDTWDDNDPTTWKWQLDHIIPHSTFKYETMDCQEFRDCWALSNLRPLSAKQNQLDGATKIRHKKNKQKENK